MKAFHGIAVLRNVESFIHAKECLGVIGPFARLLTKNTNRKNNYMCAIVYIPIFIVFLLFSFSFFLLRSTENFVQAYKDMSSKAGVGSSIKRSFNQMTVVSFSYND